MPTRKTGLRQRPDDCGFTLVELMFTVVVLAILAVAALPSFRSFLAAQRIKNTSFDIIAMLTLTRSEAMKRNVQISATPVSNDWARGWAVAAPDGTVISQKNAIAGAITITCFQGNPLAVQPCSPVRYDASGRAGTAQSIQITAADAAASSQRCIGIDLSGRPNSKKGPC